MSLAQGNNTPTRPRIEPGDDYCSANLRILISHVQKSGFLMTWLNPGCLFVSNKGVSLSIRPIAYHWPFEGDAVCIPLDFLIFGLGVSCCILV